MLFAVIYKDKSNDKRVDGEPAAIGKTQGEPGRFIPGRKEKKGGYYNGYIL